MSESGHAPSQTTSEPGLPARPESESHAPYIEHGTCYVLLAYDVGFSIDLAAVEKRIADARMHHTVRSRRHAPAYFEYDPPPVRVSLTVEPVTIGPFQTAETVEAMVYDFGAVSVTYRIPLHGPLADLRTLSQELYDHLSLMARAREHVQNLLTAIAPAVSRPLLSEFTEDYVIYQIGSLRPEQEPRRVVRDHAPLLAQVLRSEDEPLSDEEVQDALACRMSFGPHDVALIDWNAAAVFDPDADDVRAVLEYANVELLEMRYLDNQLDNALDESYAVLVERPRVTQLLWRSHSKRLRRVAGLQMDAALVFEGVNNALKLLGDQYLARLYRAASKRLHVDEWEANILRKLNVLDGFYEKTSDHLSHRRLELLEWIIIILIALSIILSPILY